MPRGPSHTLKTFTAKRVFTDREMPQEAFINAVHTPQTNTDNRILNFHGIGGQGKTALCEQFTKTLDRERTKNTQLGWARLDFQVSDHRLIASALLEIRLQLAQQCNIPFPAFDTAFACHFAFSRPGHRIHSVHPDLFKQPNSILQDIETVIGDILGEVPGAGLLYKYAVKLSNATQKWWQRRGKAVLKRIDMFDQHKLLTTLPTYLGADLYDWLFDENGNPIHENRRLVILCDTYESLWRDQPTKSGLEAMRVDAWVRRLVEEAPGVLFVLLGRDKLGWQQIDSDWETVIEPHLLGGLSSEDADQFLQQVPIEEEPVRAAIIEASEGLPFYLDLQIDLYEVLKQQNRQPVVNDFGGNHQEILARFIDHLDTQDRRVLQIVSHARFINEELARQLAEKFLGGKAQIDFKRLTDYSFWKQEGGIWYLHALMHDCLQDRQRNDEPGLFADIHQYLFECYDSQLAELEQVADITAVHQRALAEAGYHLQNGDAGRFPGWASERGQLFYQAYTWEQLMPLWKQARQIAESFFGEDHPDVAQSLINLAELYRAQGQYEAAESLYQRSLKILEAKLGEDHPDVATALNNLAELYREQGRYEAAEPLHQRSLKIREAKLGKDHPDVAQSLNNLALLYDAQGRYEAAKPLYQRSLKIREAKLGKDHPHVATALNNLALLYVAQGRYEDAEPLYQRSVKIREAKLGKDHPHVATTLNNLAELYRAQGRYEAAEPLYQRSLKILEAKLGEDHPHVATALNNLALLYVAQGRYEDAEPLYQRAIVIMEKVFPDGHPDLDLLKANYAKLRDK